MGRNNRNKNSQSQSQSPKKQPKNSSASKHPVSKCYACQVVLDETEDAASLQCEFCDKWACLKCTKIPKQVYDVLNEQEDSVPNFLWACDTCKGDIPTLKGMKQALATNTEQFKSIDQKLSSFDEKLDQINIIIQAEVKKVLNSGEIKRIVAEEIDQTLNEKLLEREERQTRESNIMIFKLPESDDPNPQTRIQQDVEKFDDICDGVLEVGKKTVSKAIRIGKTGGNFPRPLKIVLINKGDRNDILRNARNLKGHAVYGKIGLAKDMTPSERETEHKLREELFRRKDAGEDVRISNGRIVVANRRGSRP
jgi:hypothetical protein